MKVFLKKPIPFMLVVLFHNFLLLFISFNPPKQLTPLSHLLTLCSKFSKSSYTQENRRGANMSLSDYAQNIVVMLRLVLQITTWTLWIRRRNRNIELLVIFLLLLLNSCFIFEMLSAYVFFIGALVRYKYFDWLNLFLCLIMWEVNLLLVFFFLFFPYKQYIQKIDIKCKNDNNQM